METVCDCCGRVFEYEKLYILGNGKYCWTCKNKEKKSKSKVSGKLSRLIAQRRKKVLGY